jgi:hypothetical protein
MISRRCRAYDNGDKALSTFEAQLTFAPVDRDPDMKFFPSTGRTVFDRPPTRRTAGRAPGALLHRPPLETAIEASGQRPATVSFTRPPMPSPIACPPPAFRSSERFLSGTSSSDAPGRPSVKVASSANPPPPRRADQLESSAPSGLTVNRLLGVVRRVLTPAAHAPAIRDGQPQCAFDDKPLPTADRDAAR